MRVRCEGGPLEGHEPDVTVQTEPTLRVEYFGVRVEGVELRYVRTASDADDGMPRFRFDPCTTPELRARGIDPKQYEKAKRATVRREQLASEKK